VAFSSVFQFSAILADLQTRIAVNEQNYWGMFEVVFGLICSWVSRESRWENKFAGAAHTWIKVDESFFEVGCALNTKTAVQTLRGTTLCPRIACTSIQVSKNVTRPYSTRLPLHGNLLAENSNHWSWEPSRFAWQRFKHTEGKLSTRTKIILKHQQNTRILRALPTEKNSAYA